MSLSHPALNSPMRRALPQPRPVSLGLVEEACMRRSYVTDEERRKKLMELLNATEHMDKWAAPSPKPPQSRRQQQQQQHRGKQGNNSQRPRQQQRGDSRSNDLWQRVSNEPRTKFMGSQSFINLISPKRSSKSDKDRLKINTSRHGDVGTQKSVNKGKIKVNEEGKLGVSEGVPIVIMPDEADELDPEKQQRQAKFKKSKEDRPEKQDRKKDKASVEAGVPGWAEPRKGKRRDDNLSEDLEGEIKRDYYAEKGLHKEKQPKAGKEVEIPLAITVDGLAKLIGIRHTALIQKMKEMGIDKLANDYVLTPDEASNIALEYDLVPVFPTDPELDLAPCPVPDDMSKYPPRPPVVTIMGHVDHGKTTLLDALRNSKVAAQEAGGITQHIGAFSVRIDPEHRITFLDTPGHYIYESMRERGAKATDIVVLVVAADDGVMPQTVEAIRHALAADVPIIVAINKCDKPDSNPDKVKEGLLQHGIQVEDLGGDVQSVEISALKGIGLDGLKENILALAEVLDIRAERDIPAEGTIIESQVEKGRGNTASILIRRGILKVSDIIVSGQTWCRVRGMMDDLGNAVEEALPGDAVKVMGWKDLPTSGDLALGVKDEAKAKKVVENRQILQRRMDALEDIEAINLKRKHLHESEAKERQELQEFRKAVWEYHRGIRKTYPEAPESLRERDLTAAIMKKADSPAGSSVKSLSVVIKGDVMGTVEAISDAMKKLPQSKIHVHAIHTGVGAITESDVMLAKSAEDCVIIGFSVKGDKKVQALAKREKVDIKTYKVIYKLLDDVKQMMTDALDPLYEERVSGEARVQQIFEVSMKGVSGVVKIAGSRVTSGTMAKEKKVRVLRNDKVVFEGSIDTLKNIKKDIAEAPKGLECGISFAGFQDMREGDVIQSITQVAVPQKLED
ncbi:translation initiation factor IF-2 [Spiromyces aspiralis]|uniref:Translation initiation factor IF-2 n=1 Tax=Spiromyces aspiralis TaxID=68401 RepID=A0ACC1I1X5_9FUNG|nr:translation initiation factor IF-2 [Spiromyces aspiralis]